MRKLKVLYLPSAKLSADILSDRAVELLQSLGDVIWNEQGRDLTPDELKARLPGTDAVVTSWGSPAFTDDVVEAADRLRIVGHAAGTIKHLVGDKFWDQGCVVLSAAPEIAYSVAEYVIWAMLTMQRDLVSFDRKMKTGTAWRSAADGWGHELLHKKVGVVAASSVGRAVIGQLHAFRCDVSVFDPYLSDDATQSLGVRKVDLDELMAESDIVTIHAPVTPETMGMVTARHLGLMKDGALLVNSARGVLVDEAALIAQLQSGRIRAALDVFAQEPLVPDSPLRELDNVMLTPHMAGSTTESRRRLVEVIAEDMVRFFAGEPLQLSVDRRRLATMA